jgi:hypothetical protein
LCIVRKFHFHSLSVFFLLSFLGLFLLHFVELASIMSESSDYCQSCERNLYWSMYEIDLDEFSGDVMVAGHSIYVAIIATEHVHDCCCCSNCSSVFSVFLAVCSFLFQ